MTPLDPPSTPERPYGSYSYYEYDMARWLDIEPAGPVGEHGPTLTRAQLRQLGSLHKSMRRAIRALLLHGKVPHRRYRKVGLSWQPLVAARPKVIFAKKARSGPVTIRTRSPHDPDPG